MVYECHLAVGETSAPLPIDPSERVILAAVPAGGVKFQVTSSAPAALATTDEWEGCGLGHLHRKATGIRAICTNSAGVTCRVDRWPG